MRKKYGTTWWGKQWLDTLNNIDYSNRLPRGRTYANKGAARDIEIKENRISAKVKGSRPRPYKVDLEIPTFSAAQKARILELITDNPLYLSQLLNRELPSELNSICKQNGIHIFPSSWKDIHGSCSCPDWAVPCKHLASVLYLVASEIDKNPFLVFELHGFDLFKGLEAIGYSISGQRDVPILKADELWQTQGHSEEEFVFDKATFAQLDFSTLPNCQEGLLTLLSPNPVFFPTGDFKALLQKAYKSIAKGIQKNIKAETKEEKNTSRIMDATDEVELLLDSELEFQTCTLRDAKGKLLLTFDEEEQLTTWLETIPFAQLHLFSDSLRGLYLSYRFAQQLAIESAMIPQLFQMGKHYKIRWIAATLNEQVREIHEQVRLLVPNNLLFYKVGKNTHPPSTKDEFTALLSVFLNHFMDVHYAPDYKYQVHEAVQMFFNGGLEKFKVFDQKEYPAAIQLWLNRFYIVDKQHVPVLKIDDIEDGFEVSLWIENKETPLADLISLEALLTDNDFNALRLTVLRDMAMLAEYFPQISQLVASKGREKLQFNSETFVPILFKILPTIRLFGIKILLPKALRKLLRPQMSVALEAEESGVVNKSSIISLDGMLKFRWHIAIGDKAMSKEEFLKMVRELSGIVKLNDQYVFFDEKEIKALIDKLENPPELDHNQLLQAALTEEYEGAKVNLDKKTRKLIDKLLRGDDTAIPKTLKATLRPYQKTGYEWLYKNTRLGFGSLIADDMGLGKTLQVIATLLKLKEDGELGKKKALIIVPTTLLTNWQKEIQKFAPALKVHIYHGPNRQLAPLEGADLLITTYGVVRSETTKLQKMKWLAIIIDEAQAIKNPSTAQTKAVKKMKAPVRIAMSGTPVENRLSEYWSIFDFSNKGYLGTLTKFKQKFAVPIEVERDQKRLKEFRQVTEPFILRRLKSDKSIIKDLPDKVEKDQYCGLTKEQAALYQNVVDTTMEAIEKAEGIARKGAVLKLITALKQVCNHPTQFLKKGTADPTLSGKSVLLLDLLRHIFESGEKVIIFTQYQQMGKLLANMIEDEFGLETPFLHGGVSRKGRDEMVDDFQSNRTTRAMLLSLKAGGTGLNLTAANHVIHYDLWWNPAVEAQATDRAYRIGQERNVFVHRFIMQNTFEEKINKLLNAKKELANLTVSTGEKWIGDLSSEELRTLVKLG